MGVIGSAASAVQIVPQFAQIAGRLHVFERPPNWIVPRRDRAYRNWEKRLFSIPWICRLQRCAQYWIHADVALTD